jgi:hypothetical protein
MGVSVRLMCWVGISSADRDSHTKSFYRALQCFLIDAWDNQQQLCETSQDAYAVQELRNLPVRAGESQCLHLAGVGGGRICVVFVVLGDALVNNNNVSVVLIAQLRQNSGSV